MGADAEPASASVAEPAECTPWAPDAAASVAPVRNVATTPDTVNSVSFGSNGVSAGVWQLGTGGWKTLPGGRLDPPSRGPSTKLRLAAFDAPAPAQEVKGSPEPKAEPASPPRQRPASPQHDAPKPQPVVLQPKPRVAPPRAVQQTPVEPARAPAVPVRPIVCQQCNCKNSRCLKQYCVCFARGGLCGPECACANCANNSEDREELQQARLKYLKRSGSNKQPGQPRIVCNCKKTQCRKKYCDCFAAGIPCSEECKCTNCTNHGSGKDCNHGGPFSLPKNSKAVKSRRSIAGTAPGSDELVGLTPLAAIAQTLKAQAPQPAPQAQAQAQGAQQQQQQGAQQAVPAAPPRPPKKRKLPVSDSEGDEDATFNEGEFGEAFEKDLQVAPRAQRPQRLAAQRQMQRLEAAADADEDEDEPEDDAEEEEEEEAAAAAAHARPAANGDAAGAAGASISGARTGAGSGPVSGAGAAAGSVEEEMIDGAGASAHALPMDEDLDESQILSLRAKILCTPLKKRPLGFGEWLLQSPGRGAPGGSTPARTPATATASTRTARPHRSTILLHSPAIGLPVGGGDPRESIGTMDGAFGTPGGAGHFQSYLRSPLRDVHLGMGMGIGMGLGIGDPEDPIHEGGSSHWQNELAQLLCSPERGTRILPMPPLTLPSLKLATPASAAAAVVGEATPFKPPRPVPPLPADAADALACLEEPVSSYASFSLPPGGLFAAPSPLPFARALSPLFPQPQKAFPSVEAAAAAAAAAAAGGNDCAGPSASGAAGGGTSASAETPSSAVPAVEPSQACGGGAMDGVVAEDGFQWRRVGTKKVMCPGAPGGFETRSYFKCAFARCNAKKCSDFEFGFKYSGDHVCAPKTPAPGLGQAQAAESLSQPTPVK